MNENATAEQLPDLATPYELPPQWVDGFRRDGHVKLPGVFPARRSRPSART